MTGLGLIIALKCLLGATGIAIFDVEDKVTKIFWLWVLAVICSTKFFMGTAIVFPIIVWGVSSYIRSLKNQKISNFITFINTVILEYRKIKEKTDNVIQKGFINLELTFKVVKSIVIWICKEDKTQISEK